MSWGDVLHLHARRDTHESLEETAALKSTNPPVREHDCAEHLVFNREWDAATGGYDKVFKSKDGHTAHCVVCWKGYY